MAVGEDEKHQGGRGWQTTRVWSRGGREGCKEQSVGYSRPGAVFDEEGRRLKASREGAGRRVTLDAASTKPDATTLQKVLLEMISSQPAGNGGGFERVEGWGWFKPVASLIIREIHYQSPKTH